MRDRIIHLIEAAAVADSRTVFLTGDLGFSVVEPLQAALGERFINMGVAEANMVSVASSLAALGFIPFAYSIVPFITFRCLEQIRNDVAYQKRGVRLIGIGAGYSYGALGPSHHALEDANVMASIPSMIVCNPANRAELDRVFAAVASDPRPVYFRIARETGSEHAAPILPLDGMAYVARTGHGLTIVTSGSSLADCLTAAEELATAGLSAQVVSVPILQPFPYAAVADLITGDAIISVMEAARGNPLALGVMELLLGTASSKRFLDLHVPAGFPADVGSTETLRAAAGLDSASIAARIQSFVGAPSMTFRRTRYNSAGTHR